MINSRNNNKSINILFVTISFCFPFLGMIMLIFYFLENFRIQSYKPSQIITVIICLFYGCIGYVLLPKVDIDLVRYFKILENISNTNSTLNVILKKNHDFLYSKDILFFIVAKTNDIHILPYIVGSVIYGISFYILFDMLNRFTEEFPLSNILMIVLMMTNVVSVVDTISNTRCVLSYIIISFAVYRDIVQKKKNLLTVILYIIPIGLHLTAIIFIIIRLFHRFIKILGRVSIIIAILIPAIIDILYQFFGNMGGMIGSLIQKVYYYLHWTSGGYADEVGGLGYLLVRIYGLFFILIIFIMISISKKQQKNISVIDSPGVSYLYLIGICTLACLFVKTGAFWRFEAVFILLSPIYFIPLLQTKNRMVSLLFRLLFLSSIPMGLFMILSYFHNLDMKYLITEMLLFSNIKIVFEGLMTILRFIVL